MEGKQCVIETRVYPQDSEVCDTELCYVCRDGLWEQKGAPDLIARP